MLPKLEVHGGGRCGQDRNVLRSRAVADLDAEGCAERRSFYRAVDWPASVDLPI
jgi:hypothetical protein